MTEREFLVGQTAPKVKIEACAGDLTVEGWDEPRILVECNRIKDEKASDSSLVLSGASDLILRVPQGSAVEIVSVRGDARVRDVAGAITVGDCGGDLVLRHCSSAGVNRVDGELDVRRMEGDLRVNRVAGDVDLRQVDGAVDVSTSGDFRAGQPLRRADVSASGDVVLVMRPSAGESSRVRAGGDLRCFIPVDASVRVSMTAGGDAFVQPPFRREASVAPGGASEATAVLGAGEAGLVLEAGGDCLLGGWMTYKTGSDWDAIGRDLGQMGVEMGALASEFGIWMERNMRDKFGDLEKNLRRKMTETDFSRARRKGAWDSAPPRPPEPPQPPGARDHRRMEILEMLQKGTISVDEAEKLLTAVERNG